MRTSLLALSVLISSTAFAGQSGNFRREEVLKAAGVKDGRVTALKSNRLNRISVVESGNKVILVQAPRRRSAPATKLTATQIKRRDMVTPAQALALASHNGGMLGSKGQVKVVPAGLSTSRTSYVFAQVSPATIPTVGWKGQPAQYSNINRMVQVYRNKDGRVGESASAYFDYIKK